MHTPSATHIRRRRLAAAVLVIIWATLIFILSSIPGSSYPTHPGFFNYIAHFGEYCILGALIATALYDGKLKTWQIILFAIMLTSAYAASDEFHQYFVPGRLSDPVDWMVDTLGASVGVLSITLFLKKRTAKKA
jgi:VanZ family protein